MALNKFIKNNVILYSNINLFISYTREIFNLKCDWENHIFTDGILKKFVRQWKMYGSTKFRSPRNLGDRSNSSSSTSIGTLWFTCGKSWSIDSKIKS